MPAQVSSSSPDRGSKLRGPSPIAFVMLYTATLTLTQTTRGLLATDLVILNYGQVPWTTPDPNYHTTPSERRLSFDRFNMHHPSTRRVFSSTRLELMTRRPPTRGLLATDLVILNYGQVPWTTPDPNYHTTPSERRLSFDRFNMHHPSTRRVFSSTRLELMTRRPPTRGLLATDLVILNYGQVPWTTPDPNYHTTPTERRLSFDRFNMHHPSTRRVFSSTRLELMTRRPPTRGLLATDLVILNYGQVPWTTPDPNYHTTPTERRLSFDRFNMHHPSTRRVFSSTRLELMTRRPPTRGLLATDLVILNYGQVPWTTPDPNYHTTPSERRLSFDRFNMHHPSTRRVFSSTRLELMTRRPPTRGLLATDLVILNYGQVPWTTPDPNYHTTPTERRLSFDRFNMHHPSTRRVFSSTRLELMTRRPPTRGLLATDLVILNYGQVPWTTPDPNYHTTPTERRLSFDRFNMHHPSTRRVFSSTRLELMTRRPPTRGLLATDLVILNYGQVPWTTPDPNYHTTPSERRLSFDRFNMHHPSTRRVFSSTRLELMTRRPPTRGLLATDLVILNYGQEPWTTPDPNYHTTPSERRLSFDRFNMHHPSTRRVFSSTRLELMTRRPPTRGLLATDLVILNYGQVPWTTPDPNYHTTPSERRLSFDRFNMHHPSTRRVFSSTRLELMTRRPPTRGLLATDLVILNYGQVPWTTPDPNYHTTPTERRLSFDRFNMHHPSTRRVFSSTRLELMTRRPPTRGLLATDLVILNYGQVPWTTPDPNYHTTPSERRLSFDRFNMHHPSTRRVFSSTRLELMTRRPRARYLDP
ncbi:hypothetical protein TNCV_1866781 [Trichonephila clavipes]|nr:hypothetical protein TNCV_1866781 [Trichonephila clavipes]